MKKLIVNADDLGLTPGVTDGIICGHQTGIVTSTSVLMNSRHIQDDLPCTKQSCPQLGIGVHLVITEGQPLLPLNEVHSLVDENGNFIKLHHQPDRMPALDLDEVRAEWNAQIEKFLSFGFRPDHLDSHHHTACFNRDIFKIMLALARDYGLPVRCPPLEYLDVLGENGIKALLGEYGVNAPAGCITSFYGHDNAVSLENLQQIIAQLKDGTYEVMCHPGYADPELIASSSYSTPRESELEILTSDEVQHALKKHHLTLVNFSAIN